MERPSKEESKGTYEKLHQRYKLLQEEWDSINHPKPKTLSRSLTDSRSMVKGLNLFDNSPRHLMSSLQHRRSPSDGYGAWKVRNNDLAVEEILRERRAAIESGRLKGRRLFGAVEATAEVGFSDWDGLVQESEVRSMLSYDSDDEKDNIESKEEVYPVYCPSGSCSPPSLSSSSASSYICDEYMEKEVVAVKGEKVVALAYKDHTTVKAVKSWLAIGLTVCAIGIISAWRFSDHGHGDEVILVPT